MTDLDEHARRPHGRKRRSSPVGDDAATSVPVPALSGYKTSPRDQSAPVDLNRSRRVGLTRFACTHCGAIKDQNPTRHSKSCPTPGTYRREGTGPMAGAERVLKGGKLIGMSSAWTSVDTGWHQLLS